MKDRNIGIDLLRILMAIAVVGVHCHLRDMTQAGSYAVPVFMILAFFFAGGRLLEGRAAWLWTRMRRFYLPFLFWALVALTVDRLWLGAAVTDRYGCDASWRSFAIHLVGGTALANNLQMWFIGNLVWLTPAFFLLLRPFRGKAMPRGLLAAVATLAVMAQYSGLNKWLFGMIPEFGLRIPGGRLLEMVPYCCLGLIAWSYRETADRLSTALRLKVALVSLAIAVFICFFGIFYGAPGFSYSGLHRMSLAVPIVLAFHLLPFERLPEVFSRVVKGLAACSMGVYMSHVVLIALCEKHVFPAAGWQPSALAETLTVSALAWALCLVLARLPYVRRLVI